MPHELSVIFTDAMLAAEQQARGWKQIARASGADDLVVGGNDLVGWPAARAI